MKTFLICVLFLVAALFETACVSDKTTGKTRFAPVAAIKEVVAKVQEVPDETKASVLEAIAWVLGLTGAGGGVTILAHRGANYYRNKSKTKSVAVDEPVIDGKDESNAGV